MWLNHINILRWFSLQFVSFSSVIHHRFSFNFERNAMQINVAIDILGKIILRSFYKSLFYSVKLYERQQIKTVKTLKKIIY